MKDTKPSGDPDELPLPPLPHLSDFLDACDRDRKVRTAILDDDVRFDYEPVTAAVRQRNQKRLEQWERDRESQYRAGLANLADGIENKRLAGHVRKTLHGKADDVAKATRGERNGILNYKTFLLGLYVNAGMIERREVERVMYASAVTNGEVADDGARQVRRTIKSALDGARRSGVMPRLPARLFEPTDSTPIDTSPDSGESGSASRLDVTDLEHGFWDSRESLRTIHTAALARMASPWAVLGCCAAKALALVSPRVTLPPLVGGPGSLNWFCALAARSGGGKGAAMAVSDELLKPEVYVRNIGSGEGMIEAYRRPADKDTGEPAGVRESVMFEADEIDTLAAFKQRGGSTTLITLRSAFSGVALGSSTKASGGFHLAKQSYRMTLVVGAQPARTGILFDETASGTPQRFMWFPATDKRVSAEPPAWPGHLDVTTEATSKVLRYGAELTIPADAERLIVTTRARVNSDEASPLDTHRLFVREKFAYALAILDGRDTMRLDDWELAGVAMEVSDYTRSWVAGQREADAVAEAVEVGRVSGIKLAAANEERDYRETQRRNGIARRVVEHLTAAGDEGTTKREIEKLFNSRTRGPVASVMNRLVADGVIVKCERRKGDRSDTERFRMADDEF